MKKTNEQKEVDAFVRMANAISGMKGKKAQTGDFIVYRTKNTPELDLDLHGIVLTTNENGVEISFGDSLDSAKWEEIKDVIKGSEMSRKLANEYNENLTSED